MISAITGCSASKNDKLILDIQSINNYAKYTKPVTGSLNYDFNLKKNKLNDEGTEYLIYFTTDKNELVRIKYLKDINFEKLEMNFYYKDEKLILATYSDKMDDLAYSIYRKNNETIFECCIEQKPIENLLEIGINYYDDYIKASL